MRARAFLFGSMVVVAIFGCGKLASEADPKQDRDAAKAETKVAVAGDDEAGEAAVAVVGAGETGEAGEVPPAPTGPMGVAECDDYVAKVEACQTFDRSAKVYTMTLDAWRKKIAEGESDKVATACTQAAGMFRCPGA